MNFSRLTMCLVATLFTLACGGPLQLAGCDADAGPPPAASTVADAGTAGASAPTGYTLLCTPDDLCDRSINDCHATISPSACIGWYAQASNCADMTAYLACNCDCLAKSMACGAYFACGTVCHQTHC